ncbi:ribokinase [Pseudoxanthomonas beigongshangi]
MTAVRKHILVAGSANLDFVVRAAHVPAQGETVLGRDFATFPGGKGANQAVAAARAGGASTRMLLGLGEDAFAGAIEDSLRDAGVDPVIVRSRKLPTGTAFICLSDDAENAITVAPGANNALRASDLPPLAAVSHLLLQLETPLEIVTAYAATARHAGVTVVLNAAPARVLPEALLDAVDVLIVNEGELETLAGAEGSIADRLGRLAVACVVVTLGARGCIARCDGEVIVQPAFPVVAVDTTAAGDTFCGALAARLAHGDRLADGLRYACAASALACMRLGAQASIPAREAVEAFLRDAPADSPRARQALAAQCGLI